ncbi:MAG: indolepyruvate ferredoxin oxidoreductase subunit alpha [Bacillota bacterium]
MKKMLLMGNEAIAWGLVEGGVQVAAAYPGTPSSEVFGTLAELAAAKGFYAEWSVNEKVALEVAAGAAYAGLRAAVSMKQVGLNVAADPLMALAYIGVKGGLVLVVADDPGPHSSQTEQDTRLFARFAKLPVLDPATPQEAKEMAKAAFSLSEALGLPVILRPTTRVAHVCQDVEVDEAALPPPLTGRFAKGSQWVIFPGLAAKRHRWLNDQQDQAQKLFSATPFNSCREADSPLGVVACGVSSTYVEEALADLGLAVNLLKIGTPYPLPAEPVVNLLRRTRRLLIIEELEPVVEEQVIRLAWQHQLPVQIAGKYNQAVPRAGEFNVDRVRDILARFAAGKEEAPLEKAAVQAADLPPLPVRPPVLCAGCPHRASFYAFKKAAAGMDVVFTGDIGCYTLGNAPPLNTVDTCLCMGASITIAAGLHRAEPDRRHVAFLGDSTFFHAGIPGLINAVYNQAPITVVVLDNRTTAMTGYQPHPGTGKNAAGKPAPALDIARLAEACGVDFVRVADPYQHEEAVRVAKAALAHPGPAVVVMRRECVTLSQSKTAYRIDQEKCLGCGVCLEELGCPAIFPGPRITPACVGCGLCAAVCPAQAIAGEVASR